MNNKKISSAIAVLSAIFAVVGLAYAASLSTTLKGRILLQVESKGEAWYVYPGDSKRYSLGRPDDAFNAMRNLGLGITNANLDKIPSATSILSGTDTDRDGLPDAFEDAIGTDKNKADTDGDGHGDKTEIEGGYSPVVSGAKLPLSKSFASSQSGKILLATERHGEAWYVYPVDGKKYFLGRPTDAFNVMRSLGLGITNKDLATISDAAGSSSPISSGSSSLGSNNLFGFTDQTGVSDSFTAAKDIGATSMRVAGMNAVIWDLVKANGWSAYDSLFKKINDEGLAISVIVIGGDPVADNKLNDYSAFLKEMAERYDGDGKSDASGSPIVTYWEIDNEPDLYEGTHEKTPWKGVTSETPNYAMTLKAAYQAIKSVSPSAKVAIGGMSGSDRNDYSGYYDSIFAELDKIKDRSSDRYFDTFNFHYYGYASDYGKDILSKVDALLDKYGYGDIEMIITETATYAGTQMFDGLGTNMTAQTEKQQATSLFKRYAYWGLNGVSRIYWYNTGTGTKLTSGTSKRLAYYAYRRLADVLQGVDLAKAVKVQDGGGVSVYKLAKNGKDIWVAWNDNSSNTNVTISGISGSSVEISDAVPGYDSGASVPSYSNGFSSKTQSVSGGKITITLSDMPVIIGDSESLKQSFGESTFTPSGETSQTSQPQTGQTGNTQQTGQTGATDSVDACLKDCVENQGKRFNECESICK